MEPYEEVTILNLSGEIPKKEGVIKNMALLLGPDFMTDRLEVETSDHAKLYLKLSYSWFFDVDKKNGSLESHMKLFQVKDFVGDCCKAMASRIRGAVSSISFKDFHKHSSDLIRNAIFKQGEKYHTITSNNLKITSVDIMSIDPVDATTQKSL